MISEHTVDVFISFNFDNEFIFSSAKYKERVESLEKLKTEVRENNI